MNDLVILHLSDLHIESKGKRYSKLLVKLLEDIQKQILLYPDKSLVVVVTGDIINKGDKKAVSNAKRFFEELKVILSDKIVALYIVPGNHDKYRTDANKILMPAYRSLMENKISYNKSGDLKEQIKFDLLFVENLWPIQEKAYEESGYFELIDYIYSDIFSDMKEIWDVVKKTYGVHVLEVKGKKYCFVLLNTAWSCIDDSDTRHIILGDFQLQYIGDKFFEITDDEKVDLTFVLGHHPLECLYGSEQDRLFDKMISFNGISANAYICGHTHDRTVINWSNNRHAIYTLMTGIGWPEPEQGHVQNHFYSVYSFNLDFNSMEILVKNSIDDGNFQPDFRIYTGKADSSKENIVRPLRFWEEMGRIEFSTAENISSKAMYASAEFLRYSSEFARKLIEITMEAKKWLEEDKENFYENCNVDGIVELPV